MKIKTAELTGAALDWAVAKCEGLTIDCFGKYGVSAWGKCPLTGEDEVVIRYAPSTLWTQAGQIIEREFIQTRPAGPEGNRWWIAGPADMPYWDEAAQGPTALIAAMRCYVTSKLGDEVDVPEELLCKP